MISLKSKNSIRLMKCSRKIWFFLSVFLEIKRIVGQFKIDGAASGLLALHIFLQHYCCRNFIYNFLVPALLFLHAHLQH